jgi:hypothetical protein
MTNLVPGAKLSTKLPEVFGPYTQTSEFAAAPIAVLLVLSALTVPLSSSSATRGSPVEFTDGQAVPLANEMLPMVVAFPLAQLIFWLVGGVAVPLLFPFVPVLPVHFESLTELVFAVVFAVPDNLEHVIPVGAAAAGPTARAVNPATGARTAAAAMDPRTICFLLTAVLLLRWCLSFGSGREIPVRSDDGSRLDAPDVACRTCHLQAIVRLNIFL